MEEQEYLRNVASKTLPLSRPESHTSIQSEHSVSETADHLRRPVRNTAASKMLDPDELAVEQLVQMGRSRGGYAAQVTMRHKKLNEAFEQGLHTCLLQQPLDDLEIAFEKFREIHWQYVGKVAGVNPDRAVECRDQYEHMLGQIQDARFKFDQRTGCNRKI